LQQADRLLQLRRQGQLLVDTNLYSGFHANFVSGACGNPNPSFRQRLPGRSRPANGVTAIRAAARLFAVPWLGR
jgi:hypothetical protein